ncbi:MAG: Holliday junction resolvase RuvX [Paludibacteraceae bacterium]|nr:Holliday junction resolvase RuvX [Paludibacteraceae bacterium]MBQ6765125.1 Holliday junction resolvase RuvX [Paludibacteraceae bacterium]MBR0064758.1 Holliday junction resolvase RuvX [Paludibacteraceae bacterium]
MGRILAIDYGRKRTGLAVTDPLRITANPLLTIETNGLIGWLRTYFAQEQVDEVVIGHPTQMNGQESESMNYIRPFMGVFRKEFPDKPITMYDERFTSVLAHQAMLAGGMKKKDRQNKAVVDKIAACIILEGYMDSLCNQKL